MQSCFSPLFLLLSELFFATGQYGGPSGGQPGYGVVQPPASAPQTGYGAPLPPIQPAAGGYGGATVPTPLPFPGTYGAASGPSLSGGYGGGGAPAGGAAQGYGAPAGGAAQGYGAPAGGAAQGYGAPAGGAAQGYGAPAGGAAQGYGAPAGGAAQGYGTPAGGAAQGYGAPVGGAAQGYGGGSPTSGGYGGGSGPGPNPSTRCTSFDQNCYTSQANSAIATALPFERRAPLMCAECVALCTQRMQNLTDKYRCSTAVYDYTFMTCDLFAVSGNTAQYPIVSYNNRDIFIANPVCGLGTGTGQVTTPGTGTRPTPRGPSSACREGEEVKYLAVQDFVQTGQNDYTVPGVSMAQCAQACTDNKLPDGTQVNCASFEFGPNEQCTLSRTAVAPTGTGTLESQTGAAYFEKICVSSATAGNCGPFFERYPQKILVGFAQTAIDSASFDECLNACIQSQQRFQFVCVSGQFFAPTGNAGEMNCVLNVQTKDTNADLFTDTDEGTDYFQIDCPGAGRSSVRRFESDPVRSTIVSKFELKSLMGKNDRTSTLYNKWTMWSVCGVRDRTRTRYRRCELLDIRQCPKETESCRQHDVAPIPDENNASAVHEKPLSKELTILTPDATAEDDTVQIEGKEVPLDRCLCMTDSLGRYRCDIGIKYTRTNDMQLRRSYCNNPLDGAVSTTG